VIIKKVFELSREVKEELTEDDVNNIIDVFLLYVGDDYGLNPKEENSTQRSWDIASGLRYDEGYCSYRLCEKNRILEFFIVMSNDWTYSKFIQNVIKVKKRLGKFGYVATGSPSSSRYGLIFIGNVPDNIGNLAIRDYKLIVYKPMFPIKKRIK